MTIEDEKEGEEESEGEGEGEAAAREHCVAQLPLLQRQGWQRIEPLPPSGSERRLFRLYRNDRSGAHDTLSSAILVDARAEAKATPSPDVPYPQRLLALTSFLTQTGLRVPRIQTVDHTHNLAIVEDLGENSYARCLRSRGIAACRPLFQRALDALTSLSQSNPAHAPETLPAFSEERFVEQTDPFAEAFLETKQLLAWKEIWRALYRNAAFLEIELAPVLGDVHVENMFAVSDDGQEGEEEGEGEGEEEERRGCGERCVFIDFQDAHYAPRCYDVVSLLEDGLWAMPTRQREQLWACYLQAYAKNATVIASAARHYDLCALHREVRMIGILHRLVHARGEERYGAWLQTTVRRCKQRLAKKAHFATLRQFLQRNLCFEQEDFEQKILQEKR